jgi:FlaA1/EpsC-like NDP-sugar epimerase
MRRHLLLAVWLLGDLLVFLGSYALAYFVRVGWVLSTDFPFLPFILVASLTAPVWLLTLVATRTFALMRRQASAKTLMYIVYAGVIGTAIFALGYYFVYGLFFSRMLLALALLFSIGASFLWHLTMGAVSRIAMRHNPAVFPTLIIGANREAAAIIRSLEEAKSPLKPVAILDGRGAKENVIEGVPVEGKLHKLEETINHYGITHLIQCSDLEQSINLLSACRKRGITYLLLPSLLGIVERDERIETLEGRPVTVVRPEEPAWKWFFS